MANNSIPKQAGTGHGRIALAGAASCAVLLAIGWFAPKWLTFLVTMAAANGLVSLGIVRAGSAGLNTQRPEISGLAAV